MAGGVSSRSLAVLKDTRILGVGEHSEEANCVEGDTYRACDLVDKNTGEVVGGMWFSGGRRITEGDFVPPDRWYCTETNVLDHARPELTHEGLIAHVRSDLTNSRVWIQSGNCSSYQPEPLFLDLFERRIYSADEFADTEVDGVPAAYYRAGYPNPDGSVTITEWWIAKETSLPLIVVLDRKKKEEERITRSVYRFSDFNEPVDIPDSSANPAFAPLLP